MHKHETKKHARPSHGHGPMMGGQKAKNFKKSFKQLLSYASIYKTLIIIAVILAFVGSIFNIIGPDFIKQITNEISKGLDPEELFKIDINKITTTGIILISLYAVGALFNYFQGFIMTTVSNRVSNKFRKDMTDKINKIPFNYYDRNNIGEVLSRLTNDVDTIGQTFNQSFGSLITAFTMFIGSLIMMFITNWVMAITAIISSLLGFVFMMIIISRSQKFFKVTQEQLGALNGHIEETYTGHTIVKAYNGQKEAITEFDKMNEKLYTANWKSQFFSGLMMPLMGFVGNLGYIAVIIVGALLVSRGTIEYGVIAAFIIYVRLFTQPLSSMAQSMTSLQSGAAASERVFEFLEEKELIDESDKTETLKDVKGDVEFKNVSFGYDESRLIIKDFSAKIKHGQKVAIVGPTGAGKTTIVNLLMRFYEINSGEILIDNINTSKLTRENVHNLFGMVLQDTWVFEGTVYENLVFNKPNVSYEEVIRVCKIVGIHHYFKSLPNRYDTVLTDKINLSSGQKQLLTIARAMIQNAPLLIFDEATSSIDTRTEVLIQSAMDELMNGRTSFVIAHRLSTIKNSDLILVMKDGDVIESGNHVELLNQKGFYFDLYNSQFEEK